MRQQQARRMFFEVGGKRFEAPGSRRALRAYERLRRIMEKARREVQRKGALSRATLRSLRDALEGFARYYHIDENYGGRWDERRERGVLNFGEEGFEGWLSSFSSSAKIDNEALDNLWQKVVIGTLATRVFWDRVYDAGVLRLIGQNPTKIGNQSIKAYLQQLTQTPITSTALGQERTTRLMNEYGTLLNLFEEAQKEGITEQQRQRIIEKMRERIRNMIKIIEERDRVLLQTIPRPTRRIVEVNTQPLLSILSLGATYVRNDRLRRDVGEVWEELRRQGENISRQTLQAARRSAENLTNNNILLKALRDRVANYSREGLAEDYRLSLELLGMIRRRNMTEEQRLRYVAAVHRAWLLLPQRRRKALKHLEDSLRQNDEKKLEEAERMERAAQSRMMEELRATNKLREALEQLVPEELRTGIWERWKEFAEILNTYSQDPASAIMSEIEMNRISVWRRDLSPLLATVLSYADATNSEEIINKINKMLQQEGREAYGRLLDVLPTPQLNERENRIAQIMEERARVQQTLFSFNRGEELRMDQLKQLWDRVSPLISEDLFPQWKQSVQSLFDNNRRLDERSKRMLLLGILSALTLSEAEQWIGENPHAEARRYMEYGVEAFRSDFEIGENGFTHSLEHGNMNSANYFGVLAIESAAPNSYAFAQRLALLSNREDRFQRVVLLTRTEIEREFLNVYNNATAYNLFNPYERCGVWRGELSSLNMSEQLRGPLYQSGRSMVETVMERERNVRNYEFMREYVQQYGDELLQRWQRETEYVANDAGAWLRSDRFRSWSIGHVERYIEGRQATLFTLLTQEIGNPQQTTREQLNDYEQQHGVQARQELERALAAYRRAVELRRRFAETGNAMHALTALAELERGLGAMENLNDVKEQRLQIQQTAGELREEAEEQEVIPREIRRRNAKYVVEGVEGVDVGDMVAYRINAHMKLREDNEDVSVGEFDRRFGTRLANYIKVRWWTFAIIEGEQYLLDPQALMRGRVRKIGRVVERDGRWVVENMEGRTLFEVEVNEDGEVLSVKAPKGNEAGQYGLELPFLQHYTHPREVLADVDKLIVIGYSWLE